MEALAGTNPTYIDSADGKVVSTKHRHHQVREGGLNGLADTGCASAQEESDLHLAKAGITESAAEIRVEDAAGNDLADGGAEVLGKQAERDANGKQWRALELLLKD